MSDKIYNFLKNKPRFCEDIPTELKCQLCLNIMVKPTFLPCGCEYCYKCLWNYLSNQPGFCVGSRQLCKSRTYSIDDISENPATNKKIMMLRVHCVHNGCNNQSNLEDIVDHIDCCDWGKQECPLVKYGCNENYKMKSNEFEDHLIQQQVKHISLIVTTVEDMKTDHGLMKNQITELTNENNELKLTNEGLRKNIAVLTSKNEELERKTEQIIENMNGFRDEIRENQNSRLMDERNVQNSISSNASELVKLSDNQKLIETKLVGVENSYQSMRSIIDNLSNNHDELKEKFERNITNDENESESESESQSLSHSTEVKSNVENAVCDPQLTQRILDACTEVFSQLRANTDDDDDDLPYNWVISNVRHKLNKFPICWSPQFLIEGGTKMQMGLKYYSLSSDLKIVIKLVPDYQIISQCINVAVINQETDQFYTSCRFNIDEDSSFQMEMYFQKEILSNSHIVKNGKLSLTCFRGN